MTIDTTQARQDLVAQLDSAAAYNDKGIFWSGHNAEQIKAMQEGFRHEQMRLAQAVGTDALGPELATAIDNGAAARDDRGAYVTLARQMLEQRHDC